MDVFQTAAVRFAPPKLASLVSSSIRTTSRGIVVAEARFWLIHCPDVDRQCPKLYSSMHVVLELRPDELGTPVPGLTILSVWSSCSPAM